MGILFFKDDYISFFLIKKVNTMLCLRKLVSHSKIYTQISLFKNLQINNKRGNKEVVDNYCFHLENTNLNIFQF